MTLMRSRFSVLGSRFSVLNKLLALAIGLVGIGSLPSVASAQSCSPDEFKLLGQQTVPLKGGGKATDFFVDSGRGIEKINIAQPRKGYLVATFTSKGGDATIFETQNGSTMVTVYRSGEMVDVGLVGRNTSDFASHALWGQASSTEAEEALISGFTSHGAPDLTSAFQERATKSACVVGTKASGQDNCIIALAGSGVVTLTALSSCSSCGAAVIATYFTAGVATPVSGPVIATSCLACIAHATGTAFGWGYAVPAQCEQFIGEQQIN